MIEIHIKDLQKVDHLKSVLNIRQVGLTDSAYTLKSYKIDAIKEYRELSFSF